MKGKCLHKYAFILMNIFCLTPLLITFVFYISSKMQLDKTKKQLSKSALKYVEFKEQKQVNLTVDALRRLVEQYNREEKIMNLNEMYAPLRPQEPVIVIFVGEYKPNLKFLVSSLQHVVGIVDTLIIFSHSYFDENVNRLIKTVNFAKVLQIFYPYSLQFYPKTFPGFQAGDCTYNMNKETANRINCTGAKSPDMNGRYRDPVLSQGKHFWWWTMNHVFEKLSCTKHQKGIFIFLEDDLFLMQDFLFMILQLKYISRYMFQCDFVSLHALRQPFFYENTKAYGARVRSWDPRRHSSVLAFDLQVWNKIKSHYSLFCNFDDSSWSHSLFHVSVNMKNGSHFKVISSTLPRAYKTTTLPSAPVSVLENNIYNTVYDILELQKRHQNDLYPMMLNVYIDIELDKSNLRPDLVIMNGGWSDPRDKELCINMTTSKTSEGASDMQYNFDPIYDYGNVLQDLW